MDSEKTSIGKATILAVDDIPDNLRLLSSILTDRGYSVRKAISGSMALIAAKATVPDIILLDINMPDMNGYEVCENLKADPLTREVPVIFISALDDILDKAKAFGVGGADYITKPFQAEEVIVRIENQLTIARQRTVVQERTTQLEREIEARKRAETAERERSAKLRQHNRVLAQLAKNPALHEGDLKIALEEITEASIKNINVERASVWLYDATKSKIQCLDLFEQRSNQHSEGMELVESDYPGYFRALEQDEPIAADDAHTDPRTREFSQSYLTPLGISSMLDIPIRIKGRTAGVICLEHVGASRHWTAEDLNFARSLADLVALAIEARERKQTESALAESQRTLATLMSNIPGIAYRCQNEPEWTMLFVSEGCYKLTGYRAEELIGKKSISYTDLIHPEDRENIWKQVQVAIANRRPFEMTYRIIAANGDEKWVWEQGQGIFAPNGELLYLEGLITDITDRKRAEIALHQSEERWQLALRATGDGIFDWNILTGEAFASPRLLEMIGYAEGELPYSFETWRSMIHPEDMQATLGALQAHLRRETPQYNVEYRNRCQDGSYKWILARGQVQWNESGEPVRMVGSHQDISDRKQAEEEVRLLLTIGQAISGAPDFETAIEVALQQICETTNWMYGEAWIPTTDESALTCSPRWYCQQWRVDSTILADIERFREYSEALTFLPGEEIPGQVWASQQSQWITEFADIEDVLLRLELATQCGLKAAFAVPIVPLGNERQQAEESSSYLLSSASPVLAVLIFFTRSTRPEDKRLSELVKAVAAQSGTVLQQKKVQAEMNALFAAMTDVVVVRNASGRCLNVMPTNTNALYKPAAELIGRHIHESLPRSQADLILQGILKAVSSQKTVEIEYSLPIRGKEVWFVETISPLSEETAILVARDITYRVEAEEALRLEREKSEQLLLNILPEAIATQLKENTGAIAQQFNEVTILFADIVGFTPLSVRLMPIELVNLLNDIFSTFDHLAEQLGLEKIKTIGDAYMVAAGLPLPRTDHAEAIAQMALAMLSALARFRSQRGENLQIRIGINTGVVVAGVIGTKKFIYDLWGDAVNVASRMESSGQPGKIQVTAATYERLKDKYQFEKRGRIKVKGKGEMETYWLVDLL